MLGSQMLNKTVTMDFWDTQHQSEKVHMPCSVRLRCLWGGGGGGERLGGIVVCLEDIET